MLPRRQLRLLPRLRTARLINNKQSCNAASVTETRRRATTKWTLVRSERPDWTDDQALPCRGLDRWVHGPGCTTEAARRHVIWVTLVATTPHLWSEGDVAQLRPCLAARCRTSSRKILSRIFPAFKRCAILSVVLRATWLWSNLGRKRGWTRNAGCSQGGAQVPAQEQAARTPQWTRCARVSV